MKTVAWITNAEKFWNRFREVEGHAGPSDGTGRRANCQPSAVPEKTNKQLSPNECIFFISQGGKFDDVPAKQGALQK
jgi:hypothetical protein